MVFRYGGQVLSGIKTLQSKYGGKTAVVCCSGVTLERYDDSVVPKKLKRIAVNEAIKKLGKNADFWVLSDEPIVHEYGDLCQENTTVLAMKQATRVIGSVVAKKIYTVDSMPELKDFNNGFQFFSRGTVMIGAIEMARYMGFKRFFCFGLDCYRTRMKYYYDGRRPLRYSENITIPKEKVKNGIPHTVHIWVTVKLRRMIDRLNAVKSSGLWDDIEIYCVDSEYSQQTAIPKISLDEFKQMASEDVETVAAKKPTSAATTSASTSCTTSETSTATTENSTTVSTTKKTTSWPTSGSSVTIPRVKDKFGVIK